LLFGDRSASLLVHIHEIWPKKTFLVVYPLISPPIHPIFHPSFSLLLALPRGCWVQVTVPAAAQQ
jgi:hypothetical protein